MNVIQRMIRNTHIRPFFGLISLKSGHLRALLLDLRGIKHQLVSVISELRDYSVLNRVYLLDLKHHGYDELGTPSRVHPE